MYVTVMYKGMERTWEITALEYIPCYVLILTSLTNVFSCSVKNLYTHILNQ